MNELNANLRYTAGSSDKVYQCEVQPDGQGNFNVRFAYGRYGSTLRPGTKNSAPVDLAKATAIFNKLVKEKLSEGYQEVGGATTQFTQVEKKHSGIYPMLLTPITEERVPEFLSNDWWMQEKHDGERLLIRKKLAVIVGINKKGEERPIPAELAAEIALIDGDVLLDGELVGNTYWVFDILDRLGFSQTQYPYVRRYDALKTMLTYPVVPARGLKHVKRVLARVDQVEKEQFFNELRDRRAEGMVFIDPMSEYLAGRGSSRLKFKFTSSATCRVSGLNGDKRSVKLQLRSDNLTSLPSTVEVGNCTILPNFTMPHPGDLVEIRYLYAFPGGCLFQAVYLGPRTDQTEADDYQSLKFKAGTDEDDG